MNNTMLRALAIGAGLTILSASGLAQTPNFSKYVALGDSYGAAFGSGCLVARHQAFSGPNILARQLGFSDFQQPTISDPGIPTCNALLTIVPSVTFGPISTKTGAPTNFALGRPYDNLSVPGFKIADVSDTVSGGLADVVLRGKGSALNQALSLNPTFITLTIVGNDILPAPGAGFLLDGVTATPLALFTSKYNSVAAALKASGRTGVFLGTGDVRQLPLLTAIKPVVTDATGTPILVGGQTVPLLGPRTTSACSTAPCPLPPGTLVTLGANAPLAALGGKSLLGVGFGIPCAVAPSLPQCGKPLPDGSFSPPSTVNVGVLLYPDEVQAIDDRIRAMNDVIKAAASANGFIYFDTYALAQSLGATGFDIGGMHITKDFVTGGFFSFGDAVHPSNIGYMVVVDAVIQLINSAYSTRVPRPDFSAALFTPDVPAAGTAGIGPVDTSVFFTEESWRAFFEEFPPYDPSLKVVLPAGSDPGAIERSPVVRVEPRRRDP
jgi:hypothetical protein